MWKAPKPLPRSRKTESGGTEGDCAALPPLRDILLLRRRKFCHADAISNSFTVMFWAKGWPAPTWVSKCGGSGYPTVGWQLGYYNYNTSEFSMVGSGPTYFLPGSIASNDGQWHHYAGTYDAIMGLRILYVDGKVAGTLTGNTNYTLAPECHLMIGGNDIAPGNSYGYYFGGLIYDVRIYTAALTQSQITAVLPPTVTKRVIPGANGGQWVLSGRGAHCWKRRMFLARGQRTRSRRLTRTP